jgi:hydroxymethylpyrimidine pyrophosphatase-like HAD family hydrolase
MHTIKLIVTDLDGTLIGSDNEYGYSARLAGLIASYRERDGAVWVICSGRSRQSIERSILDLCAMGLDPDYVIVKSAYTYVCHRYGIRPMVRWNWRVRLQAWRNVLHAGRTMRAWHREINKTFKNVLCLRRRRNQLSLRFRNREDADAGAEILRKNAKGQRYIRIHQYIAEVDIRNVTHTKGTAVAALAANLGVLPAEILCIGNGISDMSMLDESVCALTGCPGNAEADVMDRVHQRGGFIAEGRSMEGVVEILQGYFEGIVKNALPSWWSPSHVSKHHRFGHGGSRHPPRKPIQTSQRIAALIVVFAVYTVLLVFARFSLIPFARYINLPFEIFAILAERIFRIFT